jgi:glutamate synthase domain-containing protein 3
MMGYKLGSDEVAVLIKPVLDEDGEWTKELRTGITFGKDVKGEAGQAAVDAALTMAAALAFIQDNDEILDHIDEYKHEILKEMYPNEYAEVLRENEEASGYTTDGNVIKLNAWTKTQGNA